MTSDMLCPRCPTKLETPNHTFMNCNFARKVWFRSILNINFSKNPEYEFKDWLHHLIATTDEETIIYAASTIYNLWFARNKLIFEDKLTTEEEVIQQINKNLQEYKSCALINNKLETMQQHPIVSNHSRSRTIKWKKTSLNLYEVNTDANLSQEGIWGLGAICRDSFGNVLAATTWKREGANEPTEAEAFAMYSAMEFAAQNGFFFFFM